MSENKLFVIVTVIVIFLVDGDLSSKIYDLFDLPVKYFEIF